MKTDHKVVATEANNDLVFMVARVFAAGGHTQHNTPKQSIRGSGKRHQRLKTIRKRAPTVPYAACTLSNWLLRFRSSGFGSMLPGL